ncbi:hypothetical protein ANTPLA_LOCUS4561 [Anthophora plagiata]
MCILTSHQSWPTNRGKNECFVFQDQSGYHRCTGKFYALSCTEKFPSTPYMKINGYLYQRCICVDDMKLC